MREVSAEAGVSISTVSHVINGTRTVSPHTHDLVMAAIVKTGYTRNSLARSLRTAKTRTIGLVIAGIANPYFTDVIDAFETTAAASGYSVLLADSNDEGRREMDLLRAFVELRVDGVVFAPSAGGGANAVKYLNAQKVPLVQIDRVASVRADHVVASNAASTSALVEHLIDLGHRRIAMVAGDSRLSSTRERVNGYRRGLHSAGIETTSELLVNGASKSAPAKDAISQLVSLAKPPSAVVVGNNLMTLGTMQGLRDAKISVPSDMALVSFDDFAWAELFSPRLTTIAQPCTEIGIRAMQMIENRMAEPDSSIQRVRLPTNLMHRESCGCEPTSSPIPN